METHYPWLDPAPVAIAQLVILFLEKMVLRDCAVANFQGGPGHLLELQWISRPQSSILEGGFCVLNLTLPSLHDPNI